MDETPVRPDLTMPREEAEALAEAYRGAGVILEYGSGGSTVMAGEMTGKTIFAVESDPRWLRRMADWFAANPPVSPVTLHHGNIGETRKWGHPKGEADWRRFADYPLSVWDRPDFRHPDVVLVDGRFRVGCVLATALRILRPVVVMFDDYTPRAAYRAVERFVAPVGRIGRMARFEVTPMRLEMADLRAVIGLMQEPL